MTAWELEEQDGQGEGEEMLGIADLEDWDEDCVLPVH